MASSFIKNKAEKRKQTLTETNPVAPQKETATASNGKASAFIRVKAE